MPAPKAPSKRPVVLLFDIGGVCVVSPFQAILDYEKAHHIPSGWINYCISALGPNGAWQRLERGEMIADETFFREWKADLQNEKLWRAYYARHLAKQRHEKESDAAEETAYNVPPVPEVDTAWLFVELNRIAQEPDPHMFPALKRLRAAADARPGTLVLGALSNTSIFPPGHFLREDSGSGDTKRNRELKQIFDVYVSSAHVGMRKPEEEIYRYAVVRLHEFVKHRFGGDGVKAQDITFLDDIGANLRTARKVGMKTIKVQLGRADLAVRELEKVTGLKLREEQEQRKAKL